MPLAARWGKDTAYGASKTKAELAEHTNKAFEIADLTRNWDDGARLSIWNVIPKKRDPRG
jgi:hypothetical protein